LFYEHSFPVIWTRVFREPLPFRVSSPETDVALSLLFQPMFRQAHYLVLPTTTLTSAAADLRQYLQLLPPPTFAALWCSKVRPQGKMFSFPFHVSLVEAP